MTFSMLFKDTRKISFGATKEDVGGKVRDEEYHEVIGLETERGNGDGDVGEAFLHPCQGEEDWPEGGRRQAEAVEEDMSVGVIGFLVQRLVTLLITHFHGVGSEAIQFRKMLIEMLDVAPVGPKYQS